MCIVALAWQVLPDQPIVLISNRDEFYQRPSMDLHAWSDQAVYAGRDLRSGGTWMGVNAQGRWAVLTNFRDARDQRVYSTSRGALVQDFLNSDLSALRYAQQLEQKQCDYAGFNLIVGDLSQAVYMSNRGEAPQPLAHGVYILSNGLLSEHWEKTKHLRQRFTQELLPMLQQSVSEQDITHHVWDILQDQRQVIATDLPDTGLSVAMEQLLSSSFIQSEDYGTRSSNFLRFQAQHWHWIEKIQAGENAGLIHAMKIDVHAEFKR